MRSNNHCYVLALLILVFVAGTLGLQQQAAANSCSRRHALFGLTTAVTTTASVLLPPQIGVAESDIPDRLDVESYLRTGSVMNPMGVSGQAGKSRPETGVLLRDGSEVSRDGRTGDVLAEILVDDASSMGGKIPILASFQSPWPLATGTVFDVECRDAKSGEGTFLAVTPDTGGKSIGDLKDSFFVAQLAKPTGRFSFYGAPTDIKVRSSQTNGNYRIMDLTFSTLSQSTNTEIPRRARVVATIPEGTKQSVMLVSSASATRWSKSEPAIAKITESFRATPAPTSSLKMRAKERRMG